MMAGHQFDLIIVGGGPAGAAAALYARRQGLRFLLLDKARFPRNKICGDALSGKSVAVLDELGLLDEVRNLPGAHIRRIVFGSPDSVGAEIEMSGHAWRNRLTGKSLPMEGFVIRRQLFDQFLFTRAREAADCTVEGFAVRALARQGQQVCGVRGHTSTGAELEFSAPLVLGCDGSGSRVARLAGLVQRDSRQGMIALRQYFAGVRGLGDQIELHFIDPVLPGYFWIFPVEEGGANVGIGMDRAAIDKRRVDLKKVLQAALDSPAFCERFRDARPLGKPVGWKLPVGVCRSPMHAAGLLLLGDAAGLVDPFTGEGIGNALYSARYAVETAVAARQAADYSARFLGRYADRLTEALGPELRTSARLHWLSGHRRLINLVIHKAARNPQVRALIGDMLASAVPRRRLTNPLFYLNLLFK